MLHKPTTIHITNLLNWMEYQNRIWIRAESFTGRLILDKAVEGRVLNNSLKVMLIVPYENNQRIKLRFNMWGGASLGETIIDIRDLVQDKIRYYSLAPKNIHVVQIQYKQSPITSRISQSPSMGLRINSTKDIRHGLTQSTLNLKKKYQQTQNQLIRSISQYRRSVDKITDCSRQLNSIRRDMKNKSKSQFKLISLKDEISKQKLKFNQLVYPYINTRQKRHSRGSSQSTERDFRKYPTTSTLPDDDYGMFTLRSNVQRVNER